MQYFYDKQIRRYLQQFMRFFAGFSVAMGQDSNGNTIYHSVPVRYGDINRMTAHILKNNSDNTMNTVPFIAVYITELLPAPERRTNPTHVDQVQVYEKKYDPTSATYLDQVGNTYTISRHMPVPYDINVQVDIWTSNTDQKLQLLEQILVLFNPSLDLRNNDNMFDWSRMNFVELINTVWSTRQVPNGTDDALEIASLTFNMPIYINPPAMVTRQQLIYNIINTIRSASDPAQLNQLLDNSVISDVQTKWQTVTDPERAVRLSNGELQLLTRMLEPTVNGVPLLWSDELQSYGGLRSGISQIRVNRGALPGTWGAEIIGTLSTHPVDPNKLLVTIDRDSLPANTKNPIDGVIDPHRVAPGAGLPPAALGQRYIVVSSPPDIPEWGGLVANPEDIIEYNGTSWVVSFVASAVTTTEYVLNTASEQQLAFMDGQWILSYEGIYQPGYWRLLV
jgi:T4-like virus Myoviridae tail sheath stabiliser